MVQADASGPALSEKVNDPPEKTQVMGLRSDLDERRSVFVAFRDAPIEVGGDKIPGIYIEFRTDDRLAQVQVSRDAFETLKALVDELESRERKSNTLFDLAMRFYFHKKPAQVTFSNESESDQVSLNQPLKTSPPLKEGNKD